MGVVMYTMTRQFATVKPRVILDLQRWVGSDVVMQRRERMSRAAGVIQSAIRDPDCVGDSKGEMEAGWTALGLICFGVT
ncbi:hypothetical protein L6452_22020 [Arctium lappa]|uniref:Uncharacterized protein n=1 Tax=Arctium lappa TaxID=4217 RepID=A0ACB9AY92_ARCLA|nr:hypothetical protein L6452_22020 [Arctium lappa]